MNAPAAAVRLSAYILTRNEAAKIVAAIESVRWADEVVVADSGSTDGTVELATGLGARVEQIPFHGFGDLRNRAVATCRGEWIFSLDADERCTPEVRDEIRGLVAGDPPHDAFLVPRRNWFMGRWIEHSGWYPNYRQPQLFRRGALTYTQEAVHEGYRLAGPKPLGRLRHAIWQVPFADLEQVVAKANRYSTLGAIKIAGKRVTMWTALTHAAWSFFKHLVLKGGLLDGWAGFVIAFAYFEQTFYRYAKRVEMDAGWPAQPPQPPGGAPGR